MAIYPENSLGGYGTFTARVATGETVTSGDWVKTEGTEITSTSTIQDKMLVSPSNTNGDEALIVGIALMGGSAGEDIPIATRGIFRLVAHAGITAGNCLTQVGGAGTMRVKQAEAGGRIIGIALTTCNAAADYVLVLVNVINPTGAEA